MAPHPSWRRSPCIRLGLAFGYPLSWSIVSFQYQNTTVSGLQQHGEVFAQIGTIEWLETPVGMIYAQTRRVGENAFIRINDILCPNIVQVSVSATNAEKEGVDLPRLTSWAVPIDKTNTMNFRISHVREGQKPPKDMGFGQTGDRPYGERQRKPGDYDAQVSQRPIAVHALERLVTSDRGVIMYRRMVREGIQAVRQGEDPKGIVRADGDVSHTYCSNTVVQVPPAAIPEAADQELLKEASRKVVESYFKTPPTAVSGAK